MILHRGPLRKKRGGRHRIATVEKSLVLLVLLLLLLLLLLMVVVGCKESSLELLRI